MLRSMSRSETEYRYRDRAPGARGRWLLAVCAMLLVSSVSAGVWGIAALARANWLGVNDLPSNADVWGVLLLGLATIQGIAALLILFDRRSGVYLGIIIAVLKLAAHAAVFSAYPLWSLLGIALDAAIIAILVVNRPR